MTDMTPEEQAEWHDRVTAQRAARRAEVMAQVIDNYTERTNTHGYQLPGNPVGQSDQAAAQAREQTR